MLRAGGVVGVGTFNGWRGHVGWSGKEQLVAIGGSIADGSNEWRLVVLPIGAISGDWWYHCR